MKKYYGFWALFENNDNRELNPIIRKLSRKELDGNVFPPHLSIYPAVCDNLDSIKDKFTLPKSS